jgi:hypothetical protein
MGMNPTHRLRAVLKITKTNIPTLLAVAKAMLNAFKANTTLLPQPTPPVATVQTQMQDLDAAQQATSTRAKGTTAVRNAKRDLLMTSLESWRMYVQSLCDASPEQAEAIITAATMSVAKVPMASKPVLEAKLGTASGGVVLLANETLLVGRGVRKRSSFNWQLSADGGKAWTGVPSTPLATTTIDGLTPLATYAFRVSVTVSKTTGAWSQAVTIVVH